MGVNDYYSFLIYYKEKNEDIKGITLKAKKE